MIAQAFPDALELPFFSMDIVIILLIRAEIILLEEATTFGLRERCQHLRALPEIPVVIPLARLQE